MKAVFYDWGGINVWLFHLINNIRFDALDSVMLAGTAFGAHQLFYIYVAILSLAAVIAVSRTPIDNPTRYRSQTLLWISTVAVFCIAYALDGWLLGILKPLLDFPRPPLALPAGTLHIIGRPEYHHSLPSGHSSFAMLVTASLWPVLNRGQRAVGMLFVIWVGVSRISLGAHFPADVLAGWLSSLIIVLMVRYAVSGTSLSIISRYQKRY
jgi:membrane-associated phospholipid phosphatase